MRNTLFKSMKNAISLGAIACGSASSREKERGCTEIFNTFNINHCFSSTQPETKPSVEEVMLPCEKIDRWAATAALWRKGVLLENMGMGEER